MLLSFFIFTFVLSFIALGVASGLVANAFLGLSRAAGVNEYLVSFIFMGVATSLPEMFVAVASLITGNPAVSIGNIIGANLANITLVLGLVVFFSGGIELGIQIPKKIFWTSFLLVLLPSFLVFGGGINRSSGFLLCLIFISYAIIFFMNSKLIDKPVQHLPYGVHIFSELYVNFRNLFVGLLFLILSSIFIVFFGSSLAQYMSLDLLFFSTIFLGLVTTIPELLFGIRSALLRHPTFAMGNLLASVVYNATLIPGVLSIFSPIQTTLSRNILSLNAGFTFVAFLFLSIFSYSGSRITKNEGLLLILLYVLFFILTLAI